MITVPLRDGTFHKLSLSLGGENADEAPQLLRWQRVEGTLPDVPVTVFTDMCLEEAIISPSPAKVAILIEPAAFSTTHYDKAERLEGHFDAIFTYDLERLTAGVKRGAPWRFYPFGGSWIREWHVFEKLRLCSLIVSDKHITKGHKWRHRVAEFDPGIIDVWGEPYGERFEPKHKALRHYMYSVVVESGRADYYFTEKLIDCLSQGTVPIYWGCPSVLQFFEPEGIIPFETLDDLGRVLASISEQDYRRRLPAVRRNLELACEFRCAEDWLAGEHGWLFEGTEAAAEMRRQSKEQSERLARGEPITGCF
jgi:hypothetical protein